MLWFNFCCRYEKLFWWLICKYIYKHCGGRCDCYASTSFYVDSLEVVMQPSDVNEKLIVLLESTEVNSFKEVTMEENQTQLKTQSCSTMLLVDISSITEQFDKKNILAAGTLQRQHGNGITINSVVAFVSIAKLINGLNNIRWYHIYGI